MTSHLSKNWKKQHASELWSILVLIGRFGLFKGIARKHRSNCIIHAKEMSFSTKRKEVKDT